MLRVTIYLKSGAVADFDAEAMLESAEPHPKFRLDFAAPENGGRRLVYLDRDDVSAVVVEERGERDRTAATQLAEAIAPLTTAASEDVLTVSLAATGPAAP